MTFSHVGLCVGAALMVWAGWRNRSRYRQRPRRVPTGPPSHVRLIRNDEQ